MKILVVDDDFTSRMLLQEALDSYGEVHTCVNGMEAIEAVNRALDQGRPYDLICLDIMMPGRSGLDTLKQIRTEEESRGRIGDGASKVIMVTALSDARNVMRAFRELCNAYLVKPISIAEVHARLSALGFTQPAPVQPE